MYIWFEHAIFFDVMGQMSNIGVFFSVVWYSTSSILLNLATFLLDNTRNIAILNKVVLRPREINTDFIA